MRVEGLSLAGVASGMTAASPQNASWFSTGSGRAFDINSNGFIEADLAELGKSTAGYLE